VPVTERAAGRDWSVAPDGFWQVHPGGADALVGHVRRMLAIRAGERLVDLYAGVGLFGLALADDVSGAVDLTLVEGDRRACELAAVNAGDPAVTVVRSGVDRWVSRPGALDGVDVVVLDPPRTGAGAAVVTAIASAHPRAVAYVACDPVALARDLATFREHGLVLDELVALDLFPTTHHVECVAKLTPR
jgi:tRNA/tmRNA/rRNA uracil-C5-methylase (TrmA/RlmC/RlmD family)